MVIALEVAGPPLWHVSLDVSTTVITSPFAGTYEYVGLLVPVAVAPLYHWYDGVVPPLVGVAVKVTVAPEQTGLASAAIEAMTGRTAFTIVLLLAGEDPVHPLPSV